LGDDPERDARNYFTISHPGQSWEAATLAQQARCRARSAKLASEWRPVVVAFHAACAADVSADGRIRDQRPDSLLELK
jgi:hypothetical protein